MHSCPDSAERTRSLAWARRAQLDDGPRRMTMTVTSSVDPRLTAVEARMDAIVSHGTERSTVVSSSARPRLSKPPPPPAPTHICQWLGHSFAGWAMSMVGPFFCGLGNVNGWGTL